MTFTTRRCFVAALVCAGVVVLAPAGPSVAGWDWPLAATEESTPRLLYRHDRLMRADCVGARAVPVQDRHLVEQGFDLHLRSGTLYVCPAIEGALVWATFVGDATVAYAPASRAAQAELFHWLGLRRLDAQPIDQAHFFTVGAQGLAERLGLSAKDAPPADAPTLDPGRRVFRRLGTRLTQAWLDRGGRGDGATYVAFPLQLLTRASSEACALFSVDRQFEPEVQFSVAGHHRLTVAADLRHAFVPIATERSARAPFRPAADALLYETSVEVGRRERPTRVVSTVTLRAGESLAALRFALTPRLRVVKARDAAGTTLPFLQWRWKDLDPPFEDAVLVELAEPMTAGSEQRITIEAEGPLVETVGSYRLGDTQLIQQEVGELIASGTTRIVTSEDDWYPRLDDDAGALHDVTIRLEREYQAIGPGALVEHRIEGKDAIYRFRTESTVRRATFYVGDFRRAEGKADGITLETYVNAALPAATKNIAYAQTEIANALRVLARILLPLEQSSLRVVSTPVPWGRGFEGVLLLAERGGFRGDLSAAETFRSHEAAHQWWGNLVDVRSWPRDRWLMESTAEYVAMEYYRLRFEKADRWREHIDRSWGDELLRRPELPRWRLTGEKLTAPENDREPLILGGQNVYTKGPLVLHSLRYLFRAKKGSEGGFWEALREVLRTYAKGRVSTEEFIAVVERHLGEPVPWFWDQWLFGTGIPTVAWSHRVEPRGDKWAVTVTGKQADTAFLLAIPVYLHLPGGKQATVPLWLDGKGGTATVTLPVRPEKVTLNDFREALVRLK